MTRREEGAASSVLEDVNEGTNKQRELIYGVSFLLPALYGHGASRGEERRRNGRQKHVILAQSSGPSLMNSQMRIWSVMRLFAGTESSQMSVFICFVDLKPSVTNEGRS